MFGRKRASADASQAEARPDSQADTEALNTLFDAIEDLAQRLYGAHGLPDRSGHYQRSDEDNSWSLISETLTPDQKFDLVLSAPKGERRHYAAYERLGAEHPNADVRKAAALLSASRELRQQLRHGGVLDSQTLCDAIRLGAIYQDLASGRPELRGKDIIAQPPAPSLDRLA